MSAVPGIQDRGLNPFDVALRIVEAADRLHDLADAAQNRGRIGDAARAIAVEVKTLNTLLTLGLKGEVEVDVAKDAVELEQACAALVQRAPTVGGFLADQLEAAGRVAYAAKFRRYADRCKIQILETRETTND